VVISVAAEHDITHAKKSRNRIAVIENGNWIYILRGRKVPSSLNDIDDGAAMNAYTTTTTRIATESKLARMFRAFCVEARRAIEIVGAAYQNGLQPPM
jgi:hypothetical protein